MRNLRLLAAVAVAVGNAPNTVTVSNNLFSPPSLSVAPGTTVTWQWNSGGTAHTVTFDDGWTQGP